MSANQSSDLTPRITLGEYISALIDTLGAFYPAALARMRQVVGARRSRIILDDEAVVVSFGPEGLRAQTIETVIDVNGIGETDSITVLDLLDGNVEVVDAILVGRLNVSGNPEDIVRIFVAIEILLDASPRMPELQALADRFRLERAPRRTSATFRPRTDWYPFASTKNESDLLARLDVLPRNTES